MIKPIVCKHCKEAFELAKGIKSEKWYKNTLLCKSCSAIEKEEVEREYVEDQVDFLTDEQHSLFERWHKLKLKDNFMLGVKQCIIDALHEAYAYLDRIIYKSVTLQCNHNVEGIMPTDLITHMKENNIPSDAYLGAMQNERTQKFEVVLISELLTKRTKKEVEAEKKNRFAGTASTLIGEKLNPKGFYRAAVPMDFYKENTNEQMYEKYIAGDYDSIVEAYLILFTQRSHDCYRISRTT